MRRRGAHVPALVAATVAAVLTAAKLVVGFATGSMAVLAAAVDNLMDLACSGLNAYFLRLAEKPADYEHRFGHGKADALSAVIQATIIGMGGLYIAVRAISKLWLGNTVRGTGAGIVVSLLSLVIAALLGLYLTRAAARFRSVALRADAFHYLSDVATNSVAALALVLVRLTGKPWWDLVGSVAIAAYIVQQALAMLRESADELLDRGLPHDLELAVVDIIDNMGSEVRGYDELRTRKAAHTVFVEVHLLLDRDMSFSRSHELAESFIRRVRRRLGESTQVMVDTDPA